MSKFLRDLDRGKLGEEVVFNFLKNYIDTKYVLDVRDDKLFQELDIDFIQETYNTTRKIEVKTDTMAHRTGNLAYEHTSNKYANTIGCFEKTKADYIFYYLTEPQEVYILETFKFRDYVHKNKNRFREVPMGDNALGYLIKLEEIEEKGLALRRKI